MFCPNCGKELKKAGKFCPACGKELYGEVGSNVPQGRTFPWKGIAIALIAAATVFAVVLVLQKRPDTAREAVQAGEQQRIEQSVTPTARVEDANATGQINTMSSIPQNTPVPMADYEWLENQAAIKTKKENFIPKYWDISDKFHMSAKEYAHGVCITMKGSKHETTVSPKNGDVWTEPYVECYLDVPFGGKFFKMTFDIGFDEAHMVRWGAPDANGYARLVLEDIGNDKTLYDTGIVDYSFHSDWVNIDTTGVNVLRMTYQVSPVVERQSTSLNLLLGQALMYKFGDGYAMTEDYTPKLTALPKDYRQYEASATDNVERFILRGFRDRYSRVELEQFSRDEMELVLNGVYALSGKWFQRAELWNYFTTKPWYYPVRIDITKDEKNNFQNENEDTITAYMKFMGWR